MNRYLNTLIIGPMISNTKKYPTWVSLVHTKIKVCIVIDQKRTAEKSRVLKVLGNFTAMEIKSLKQIIKNTSVD